MFNAVMLIVLISFSVLLYYFLNFRKRNVYRVYEQIFESSELPMTEKIRLILKYGLSDVPFIILFSLLANILLNGSSLDGKPWGNIVISYSYSAAFWVFMWKGNLYLSYYLWYKLDWLKKPVASFFTTIISVSLLIWVVNFVIHSFFVLLILEQGIEVAWKRTIGSSAYLSIIISLVLWLFFYGRMFLKNWKESVVRAEQLEKENLKTRYAVLQEQLSPHFLFNSFNVVSDLIYSDQALAVDFIQKLSNFYRFAIDHQYDELVPLNQEMKMVRSYVFLHQTRVGERQLIYHEEDLTSVEGSYVPPFAVQLLIENAIKHNEVSMEKRLKIEVSEKADYLLVRNDLNPSSKSSGTGTGLQNIRSRYAFFTKRQVEVTQDANQFQVRLPLIQIDEV